VVTLYVKSTPGATRKPPLEEILNRLDNVSLESNGQYRADCPAHDSKSGTALHIKEGDNGEPVIYCFAGCSYENILRELGLWNGGATSSEGKVSNGRNHQRKRKN
jgi:hypothetical protein